MLRKGWPKIKDWDFYFEIILLYYPKHLKIGIAQRQLAAIVVTAKDRRRNTLLTKKKLNFLNILVCLTAITQAQITPPK